MSIKTAQFERIVRKLSLETRNSGDRLAWFVYEGKRVVYTRRSNKKGDLPAPHQIRQQLKLDEDQFRDLIRCSLTYDDYVEILRSKKLIPDQD